MGVKIESKQHTIQDKTKMYALITLLCPLYLTTSSQRYCEDPSHASPKGYINQNEKGRGENYKQKKTKKKDSIQMNANPLMPVSIHSSIATKHQATVHCPSGHMIESRVISKVKSSHVLQPKPREQIRQSCARETIIEQDEASRGIIFSQTDLHLAHLTTLSPGNLSRTGQQEI